jgi:hypothetical protein
MTYRCAELTDVASHDAASESRARRSARVAVHGASLVFRRLFCLGLMCVAMSGNHLCDNRGVCSPIGGLGCGRDACYAFCR